MALQHGPPRHQRELAGFLDDRETAVRQIDVPVVEAVNLCSAVPERPSFLRSSMLDRFESPVLLIYQTHQGLGHFAASAGTSSPAATSAFFFRFFFRPSAAAV